MKKIYIIHENEDWLGPLRESLNSLSLPYEEWFIGNLSLDLSDVPPEGVFYNRMSASAHTRNHRFSPEYTENLLAWLELHERNVVNGRRALQLELRKSEQYIALQKFMIPHPKTIVVNSVDLLSEASHKLNSFPFIVKPNRGGKGTGVQLFSSTERLRETITNGELGESLDGIWLVQEYIKSVDGRVVRAEFIGGEFLYAVSIDSSDGFELCPADSCNIGDSHCPVGSADSKFVILENYINNDLEKYKDFLQANNIQVGALEYAEDVDGTKYVYDVNTNTNYNSQAEDVSETDSRGMEAIAQYLGAQLTFCPQKWC